MVLGSTAKGECFRCTTPPVTLVGRLTHSSFDIEAAGQFHRSAQSPLVGYRWAWGGRIVMSRSRKSDPWVEETLAFAREASSSQSNRDVAPVHMVEVVETVMKSNLPKAKDALFEREEIQARLSEFKAIQLRFARERDEYFKKTMANIRLGSPGKVTWPLKLPRALQSA